MSHQPIDAARAFVEAVAWGAHQQVWSLLTAAARDEVLAVARRRGMDDALAASIAAGTAAADDTAGFLVDLVNGLRADLGDADLDDVDFEEGAVVPIVERLGDDTAPTESAAERGYVTVVDPPAELLAEHGAKGLPTAVLELEVRDHGWGVVRVIPVRSG